MIFWNKVKRSAKKTAAVQFYVFLFARKAAKKLTGWRTTKSYSGHFFNYGGSKNNSRIFITGLHITKRL